MAAVACVGHAAGQRNTLTLQVLLLGRHHLMRGGFADGAGHVGARQLVLRRGDAIRERLPRHFVPPMSRSAQECVSPGDEGQDEKEKKKKKRKKGGIWVQPGGSVGGAVLLPGGCRPETNRVG